MKANKFKYINLLLLVLITNPIFSQQISISPVPGSKYHNPETSIILKFESPVKFNSIKNDLFIINGSKKGYFDITYETSHDQKTIVLKTNKKFDYGETIFVHANKAIELETGLKINIPDFSFHIKYFEAELTNTNNEFSTNLDSKNEDYFPPITVSVNDNPADGKIFFHNLSALASDNDRFYAIIENDGTPFFKQQDNDKGLSFTLQKNGYITFWNNKNFYMLDSSYSVIDSFACGNGYEADWHELQVLENGHAFLVSWDLQIIDMSQIVAGGQEYATVEGLIIQEIDEKKDVIFQWRSWDHFEITDAVDVDFTTSYVSYTHGNAIEIDTDGNILVSLRLMNEITKIDRVTGNIIWRLGGKNNEFTFINDDGFCRQHDIRRLPNGNITLYDNGECHTPQISKAKEYELDETNKTATLVWEYEHPKKIYCETMGNVQRLDNGNTFINWGRIADTSMTGDNLLPAITEVKPDKSIVYELTFDTFFHMLYRSYRFEWDVNPAVSTSNYIRNYSSKINIFPNPANKSFNINFNEIGIYNIDILNSSGLLIKSFNNININNIEILTEGFIPGVYYCRISSKGNTTTQKIVIVN